MPLDINMLTQQTIYLMGFSFIIGSLSTIFVLILLDMSKLYRAQVPEQEAPEFLSEDEIDASK